MSTHLNSLEAQIHENKKDLQNLPSDKMDADIQDLGAQLVNCESKILELQTLASDRLKLLDRYLSDRKARFDEVKQFQSTVLDIEQTVMETKGKANAALILATTVKADEKDKALLLEVQEIRLVMPLCLTMSSIFFFDEILSNFSF